MHVFIDRGRNKCYQKLIERSPNCRAGALVKWLWEETHVLKVIGLNPSTIYWMDDFSHIFVVKIVMFV